MKRIKSFLIHLLGGRTQDECIKNELAMFLSGSAEIAAVLKYFADSIYGKPADEWCKIMYKSICGAATEFGKLRDNIDEINIDEIYDRAINEEGNATNGNEETDTQNN